MPLNNKRPIKRLTFYCDYAHTTPLITSKVRRAKLNDDTTKGKKNNPGIADRNKCMTGNKS